MRIIIETEKEGRILLEPEKMGEMEGKQEEPQEAATDGGPPSDALINAIAGSTSSLESEEMEAEEEAEFTSMEEPSSFH